jgi:hypothetical protein
MGQNPLKPWVFCYNTQVVGGILMFKVELSELIDEIREIEIYKTDPQDWMNYLETDDYYAPDQELIY